MNGLRRIVACLCLALATAASMPCRAESGNTSSREKAAGVALATHGFTPVLLGAAPPLRADMQTATGTNSSGKKMSGKKKAWIIVASVVGAVAIGAALSNSGGGGSSGGGGY